MHCKIKKYTCLVLVGLMLLSTISCSPAETNNSRADLTLIRDAISDSMTLDGGVIAPSLSYTVPLYLLLQDTYYSCLIANTMDNGNLFTSEKLRSYLCTLSYEEILEREDNAIEAIFYFLEISRLIGFEVDPNLENRLIEYMEGLYCNEGFFYPSESEKYGYYEEDLTSSEAQQAAAYATAILSEKLKENDRMAILEKFYSVAERLNLSQYSIETASIIATYIELLQHLKETEPPGDTSKIINYCNTYIAQILSGESKNVDLPSLNMIVKCLQHDMLDDTLKSKLENKIYEYYNGNAFGVFPGDSGSTIISTWYAIDLLNELDATIPTSVWEHVSDYMSQHRLYTGTYLYSDQTSNISETVFAWEILTNYIEDDDVRSNIEIYLENEYQLIDNRERDLSTLHLIKYATDAELPYDTVFPMWDSFLGSKQNASDFLDITLETLFYIVDLMDKTEYTIPLNKRSLMLEYLEGQLEQLKEISITFNNDTMSMSPLILRQAILYLILNEIGSPVALKEVYGTIDLFVSEYSDLTDRLLVTKWLITMMQSYGVNGSQLNAIDSDIISDIDDLTYLGLSSFYNQIYPSFEATYYALVIEDFLLS